MAKKLLPVPQMPKQRGPNCGLYALVAVARVLDPVSYSDLYATKGDARPYSNGIAPQSLRYVAKRLPVNGGAVASQIGEVFSGGAMVALAKQIGLNARIVSNASAWTPLIKSAINNGRYLLAPFGVNDQGYPQKNGDRPHWCIVYGYEENWILQNTAFATHWQKTFQFGTSDLRKSSLALQPFQQSWKKVNTGVQYGRVGQNGIPVHAGGLNRGVNLAYAHAPQVDFDVDLPTQLAGQLVEVWL